MFALATRIATVIAVSTAAAFATPVVAGDASSKVMTYVKPIEAISKVVGSKQVAGYFVKSNDVCATTLFVASASDIYARPMKVSLDIAAAKVASIEVDGNRALAIGCSVDADRLTLATIELKSGYTNSADAELLTSTIKAASN